MVRVPNKSCPNLSNLFEAAHPSLVAAFLNSKSFERLTWLNSYKVDPVVALSNEAASRMLAKEPKDRLGPLETEAARIITISGNRGQFALEGLASTKLVAGRLKTLTGQRDELARSLWAYVHESSLFDATENSLHLHLYRRYDRHYQTFMAEPSLGNSQEVEANLVKDLLSELKDKLNRGEGYSIDRFDIPEDGDEPSAVMYLLFHPNPPTSVREMDDNGNRARIYFRPPGEAMIVYTPSTGRVHVRAGTRALRHQVAEKFIEKVLQQKPSRQPVDFQAYDISKFHSAFDLDRPVFDDVVIKSTKIIRVDVSIQDLASRLSISTSIDGDLASIVESQRGLGRILERAIATRFIEIAVRYRRKDRDEERTLDFTLSDRNTCSLLSLDDPFERVLGHRLLRHWGILRDGHPPSLADSMQALPALLELWDIGGETVSGAWLFERHIDPALLIDIGFLVPAGSDDDADVNADEDVIDDEDNIGPITAQVVSRPDGIGLKSSPGQEAPGGAPERYRAYRVRKGWVAQHLMTVAAGLVGNSSPAALDADLVALGHLRIMDREIPVYLARGLSDDKTREVTDSLLAGHKCDGVGLVLQAGNAPGTCLAGNVLTRLIDHLSGTFPEITLDLTSLQSLYLQSDILAQGGEVAEFVPSGENAGTLFVPKKGTIFISGVHRVRLINLLVTAHQLGRPAVSSDELRKGIGDQSLSNIFGSDLWGRLKAGFIRSPKRPFWELAV